MHPQLANLPNAARRLAPILESLDLPDETLADCARCVMLPATGAEPQPWHFNAKTTCCTYHPELPNYMVGRALNRSSDSAALIRQRLRQPQGRSAMGLGPSSHYRSRYVRDPRQSFGKDPSLVCPFRRDDPLSCGIWADRNAVCRTWFCKHGAGRRAALLWKAVRDLLSHVEHLLAEHCVFTGKPPQTSNAPEAWEDWYRYCADIVQSLPADVHDRLATDRLAELTQSVLRSSEDASDDRIPDVLIASMLSMTPVDGGLRVTGYSHYDGAVIPQSLFQFISRLDGVRTWQEAARLAAEQDGYEHDDALFRSLVDRRILRAPTDNDDPNSPSAPDLPSLIDRS